MRPDRGRVLRFDAAVALAVGLAAGSAAEFASRVGGPNGFDRPGADPRGYDGPELASPFSWPLYLCLALLVVGLALRRVRPRASFGVVVFATTGYLAAGGPVGPVLVAPALSLLALAMALPLPRWAPMTALLAPMLTAPGWSQPYWGLASPETYGRLVSGFALLLVPAMLGLVRRARREADQRQREQELRRYAYEERLQVARDVHDVVGHSLSVINLQAGVALHVLDRRPEEVQSSLEAIRRTSREALAELRTTLAVYREPGGGGARAPLPGLARLEDLVGALRAAGREVEVRLEGETELALPQAVDQAAYRIVQEALTNVVRHAGPAGATVRIRRTPAAVVVEVSDLGPPPVGRLVEGGGIAGMRERATALGGSLTVTQDPRGTFVVRAELPLVEAGRPG